jgi:dTDP-4-dehydrorhamnose reductase
MTSVLITGTTGLVGSHVYEYLSRTTRWDITGLSRSPGTHVDAVVDLTDERVVDSLRSMGDYDFVVHTAALTKTDVCEANKPDCYRMNVDATKNLVTAFPGSKIVFFSTYAVYNTPEGNCVETDPISPTNYYISTKIEAEKVVNSLAGSIILRPSVIFGYTRFTRQTNNYFMQLLENVKNNKKMQSPVDQYFNPVHVEVISSLVSGLLKKDRQGIFNVGCNEDISKYAFNRKVMDRFGYDEELLEGVESRTLQVIRPNNGTISSKKIQESLNYVIPSLDQMIEQLFHSAVDSG